MPATALSASAGEALLLGLTTGPICLASCGPVVVPWILVQPRGVLVLTRRLSLFLSARLTGYLLFATAVWFLGESIPSSWAGRSWFFAIVQLLLGFALLFYAAGWPRRAHAGSPTRLVQIGKPPRPSGALPLGFLTGLSLCPPFLIAAVRGAQLGSLPASLLFFTAFFAGTAIWFAPFASLGFVRRTPALLTVARITAVLLACWYGLSAVVILTERIIHG